MSALERLLLNARVPGLARPRLPLCTLLVCALAAFVQAVPALAVAGIYDRVAIEQGQWWRLITGNLVHLSALHFAADTLALLVVGWLAEQRCGRPLALLYLLAAVAVGAAVYLGVPGLRYFGGLSGVVNAVLVVLTFDGARSAGPARWIWRLLLAAVATKLGAEMSSGATALAVAASPAFVPVPLSHLAGAVAGLVFCLAGIACRGLLPAPALPAASTAAARAATEHPCW